MLLHVGPPPWCVKGQKCKKHSSMELEVIVRSPLRAKHHVVVQYMAGWMKCPLPPPPPPNPPARPPLLGTAWLVEDKEDKEEFMNKEETTVLPTPQGTSHCSCLEHCFLFEKLSRASNCHELPPQLIWVHLNVLKFTKTKTWHSSHTSLVLIFSQNPKFTALTLIYHHTDIL